MFVSVTPSFLFNNFVLANRAFSTIQGFTTRRSKSNQLPRHNEQLQINQVLFAGMLTKNKSAYKLCQKWLIPRTEQRR
jgi:hypothetical protein